MADQRKAGSRISRWLRFFAGLVMLALMVMFFASGWAPPGVCGEVLRHNQEMKIDASPFFYGDVENMTELENGLKEHCEAARLRRMKAEPAADSNPGT